MGGPHDVAEGSGAAGPGQGPGRGPAYESSGGDGTLPQHPAGAAAQAPVRGRGSGGPGAPDPGSALSSPARPGAPAPRDGFAAHRLCRLERLSRYREALRGRGAPGGPGIGSPDPPGAGAARQTSAARAAPPASAAPRGAG